MRKATVMLTAGLLMAGCSDDPTGPDGAAPTLPAVESMTFDFDHFTSGGSPAAGIERQSTPGLHWAAAALSVGVANIAVAVHLAVPVATWRAATQQAPARPPRCTGTSRRCRAGSSRRTTTVG